MGTYFMKYHQQILVLLGEHLLLVTVSVVLSLLIAIPTGFCIARSKWLSTAALSLFGALYSIPSLALFSFLIPVFGLGKTTAVFVLIVYNQYILVRNTLAGFQAVDPAIIEAGRAMGLDTRRLFFTIELPLALPIILGGVRIATVSTTGIATIAAVIHAGGLGVLLFDGLRMNYLPKMLWGALLASVLAYLGNQGILALEKRALQHARGEGGKAERAEA
ncbi:putative membrane protein [Propionispora sp. 2/2-37]|uniref:ABC transporter permease n=1 Tax=Propionispora sp. 2/2-37 TaxID=1677858 RepID=UPI0006BB5530|nr:ABC transporter permease [Propionispora sp. 2/2-37]CUH95975.1 putative membrane protein [Propionispora sp. 2/2-37]